MGDGKTLPERSLPRSSLGEQRWEEGELLGSKAAYPSPTFPTESPERSLPPPLPQVASREFSFGKTLPERELGWELGWEGGGWVGSREGGALLPKENSQLPRLGAKLPGGAQVGTGGTPFASPTFPTESPERSLPPALPQGASREFSFGKSLPISHLPDSAVGSSLSGSFLPPSLLPTHLPSPRELLGRGELSCGGGGRFRFSWERSLGERTSWQATLAQATLA